jgi:hypothetical protein
VTLTKWLAFSGLVLVAVPDVPPVGLRELLTMTPRSRRLRIPAETLNACAQKRPSRR